MMPKINDGGAAFPNSVQPDFQYAEAGMTLRDWFAGQALAGVMASPDGSVFRYVIETAKTTSPAPAVAALAYELADAMLAERSKP
jgi:hypothetical protein